MTPISNRHLRILSVFVPEAIFVKNARFFMYPTDAPSGVSNGHMIPYCCECNLCGDVTLMLLSNGRFTLLKCDKNPI